MANPEALQKVVLECFKDKVELPLGDILDQRIPGLEKGALRNCYIDFVCRVGKGNQRINTVEGRLKFDSTGLEVSSADFSLFDTSRNLKEKMRLTKSTEKHFLTKIEKLAGRASSHKYKDSIRVFPNTLMRSCDSSPGLSPTGGECGPQIDPRPPPVTLREEWLVDKELHVRPASATVTSGGKMPSEEGGTRKSEWRSPSAANGDTGGAESGSRPGCAAAGAKAKGGGQSSDGAAARSPERRPWQGRADARQGGGGGSESPSGSPRGTRAYEASTAKRSRGCDDRPSPPKRRPAASGGSNKEQSSSSLSPGPMCSLDRDTGVSRGGCRSGAFEEPADRRRGSAGGLDRVNLGSQHHARARAHAPDKDDPWGRGGFTDMSSQQEILPRLPEMSSRAPSRDQDLATMWTDKSKRLDIIDWILSVTEQVLGSECAPLAEKKLVHRLYTVMVENQPEKLRDDELTALMHCDMAVRLHNRRQSQYSSDQLRVRINSMYEKFTGA
uniref:Uncharacterized protein n=1 Tax=Tetraselmis sp. GSL018 TaxID=582737 RepID=A0A061RCS3_9CHLO|mmetsp:Transcript_25427/g.60466  ORF Transcript_25427/g.60466 Transcript_25427/m.60466 type:complete len:499 (-) Transcript_25427:77-1573(-)